MNKIIEVEHENGPMYVKGGQMQSVTPTEDRGCEIRFLGTDYVLKSTDRSSTVGRRWMEAKI